MKTMSLKNAFWKCLKRFRTAEKKMKTMSLRQVFCWYLKRFGTAEKKMETSLYSMHPDGIWNCREIFENNDGK